MHGDTGVAAVRSHNNTAATVAGVEAAVRLFVVCVLRTVGPRLIVIPGKGRKTPAAVLSGSIRIQTDPGTRIGQRSAVLHGNCY
ncbi:hypothetical protein Pelo_19009 [Pelomyxa schiedti]|nr:hypothetical protein Pelo_19009 [Pelomyxa schiedti]